MLIRGLRGRPVRTMRCSRSRRSAEESSMPCAPSSPLEPAALQPVAIRATVPQLERFRALMAREGWPVSLHRMCLDRLYARECIAQAHTSAADPLRAIAVDLFEVCLPAAPAELLR
jgi:hypothetical protein